MNVSFDFNFDVDSLDLNMGRLFVLIVKGDYVDTKLDRICEVPNEIVENFVADILDTFGDTTFYGSFHSKRDVNVYSSGEDSRVLTVVLNELPTFHCNLVYSCIISLVKSLKCGTQRFSNERVLCHIL